MIEVKFLNCDDIEVTRVFKSGSEFINIMDGNDELEPLMLDDEIVNLKIDGKKIDVFYTINDLYNFYSE
ncbi:MAG: hypothetical protein ACLTDM_15215 [Clostridium butyricum]